MTTRQTTRQQYPKPRQQNQKKTSKKFQEKTKNTQDQIR